MFVGKIMNNPFRLISDSFGFGKFSDFFSELKNIQVVVDHFLFETPLGASKEEDVHFQLVRQGFEELFKRNEEYFANLKRQIVEDPDSFSFQIDWQKLGPNDRFVVQYDLEKAKNEVIESGQFLSEYVYALTDPPYSLQCGGDEEKRAVGVRAPKTLLGDVNKFSIRKWSNDWSNYFDAGNEWWGAFLWTLVSDDGEGWWIGASTTD